MKTKQREMWKWESFRFHFSFAFSILPQTRRGGPPSRFEGVKLGGRFPLAISDSRAVFWAHNWGVFAMAIL